MDEAHIQRIKKVFLLNLILCPLLIVFWFTVFDDTSKNEHEETEKSLSTIEQVKLLGESYGLAIHPKILPPLDRKWQIKFAQGVLSGEKFFQSLHESDKELCIDAFYKGYMERCHEYYNPTTAFEAGIQYAKKVYPSYGGKISSRIISIKELNLRETYKIEDLATWILFLREFKNGFRAFSFEL